MSFSAVSGMALGAAGLAAYYHKFSKGGLSGYPATAAGYLFNWTTIPFIAVANTFMDSRQPSQIDDNVIVGPQPSFWDVPHLVELGIGAVVNMCEEYSGPIETYKQHSIVQLRLPTTDHNEPSLENINEAIKFIEEQIKIGHKVFVHCRAGRGRSGAIAFCWLAKNNPNMTAFDIQNMLLDRRPGVRKTLYQQPNCIAYLKQFK